MTTVDRAGLVVEMALTIKNGIADKSTPNDPKVRSAIKRAYSALVAEFDAGEIESLIGE